MPKSKKNSNIRFTIKSETRDSFFTRGKHIAKLLDENKSRIPEKIISFEDPKDLVLFLTKAIIALMTIIRKRPDSIAGLARRLHRSRASIGRDVNLLESAGIVESEYVINPGHGKCRIVKPVNSNPIKLQVLATI